MQLCVSYGYEHICHHVQIFNNPWYCNIVYSQLSTHTGTGQTTRYYNIYGLTTHADVVCTYHMDKQHKEDDLV